MELQGSITVNGRAYRKGDWIPWYWVYPFFLVHMGIFGLSGFLMAYGSDRPDLVFLYMHGGFACLTYLVFYVVIFGVDRVGWMLVNAALGLFGIYAQIEWILSAFGKRADDFPVAVHAIPFLYYVLYTFLLHQMMLDVFRARGDRRRRRWTDAAYIAGSLVVYGGLWAGLR